MLILDEPTNDLDTDMLAAIEDLLDSWPGTLLVVEPRPLPHRARHRPAVRDPRRARCATCRAASSSTSSCGGSRRMPGAAVPRPRRHVRSRRRRGRHAADRFDRGRGFRDARCARSSTRSTRARGRGAPRRREGALVDRPTAREAAGADRRAAREARAARPGRLRRARGARRRARRARGVRRRARNALARGVGSPRGLKRRACLADRADRVEASVSMAQSARRNCDVL